MDSYFVQPDFFPDAELMRQDIDAHFSDPYKHTSEQHQIWNYWYVPESYTYFRTDPHKAIRQPLVDAFMDRLRLYSFERFGLSFVYAPRLSLYVAGCFQTLHNDSSAARLGYVFSLTRWKERRFTGGETLIFHQKNYFGTPALTQANAALGFYDLVPAEFNQMVFFDDRIPHAVPRIEGTMNPFEGRIVMHGHIGEEAWSVRGGLPRQILASVIDPAISFVQGKVLEADFHGLFVIRIFVQTDGSVSRVSPLFDRVLPTSSKHRDFSYFSGAIIKMFKALTFPKAKKTSEITLPIAFGRLPGG